MMRSFSERWQAIGHVPFKEKDNIMAEYKEAMQKKFPAFGKQRSVRGSVAKNPKDALIAKYHALQQDITTYENNICFFAASKNSEPLIRQMQEKIDQAKEELKTLEAQIRKTEEEEQ